MPNSERPTTEAWKRLRRQQLADFIAVRIVSDPHFSIKVVSETEEDAALLQNAIEASIKRLLG